MFSTPKKQTFSATPSKNLALTPRHQAAVLSHLSCSQKRSVASPKSSIRRTSPSRLDVVASDWTLTGTGPHLQAATPKKPSTKRIHNDRFIPNRHASSSTATQKLESDSASSTAYPANPTALAYQSSVAEACGLALNTRILAFKPSAPESSKPIDLRSQYNRPLKPAQNAQFRRRVLTAPERVLDAPGLVDDYYLNLLDWSASNQVAIGLERNVYVWNADTGSVSSLLETRPDTYVAGIKWSGDGAYLSVGLGDGDVQIWDVESGTKLRSMAGHEARVGVLSWDKHIVSSGCRDGSIFNHDVRIAQHKVGELRGHTSEVCGLEWRSDGAQLASGGNDNLVNIWDARSAVPKFTKTNHKAAVKALSWCPWQLNLLGTGGGSYDRHIHFWNATTGARLNSIDTGSQVTSIRWSTVYKELVSSHGFPDNHLSIWTYPTLVKNVDIPAHETRVLHSTLSPDGSVLATTASDENLKFWKVFECSKAQKASVGNGGALEKKDMAKTSVIR